MQQLFPVNGIIFLTIQLLRQSVSTPAPLSATPFFPLAEAWTAKVVSTSPKGLTAVSLTPFFNFLCHGLGLEHVVLSIGTLQRRHDLIGPDADMFNPDRWQNWKPQIWEFIPFNHGPRICLGRNFAYMQMEYILCRLFQVFRMVELDQGQGSDITETEMKIKVALN